MCLELPTQQTQCRELTNITNKQNPHLGQDGPPIHGAGTQNMHALHSQTNRWATVRMFLDPASNKAHTGKAVLVTQTLNTERATVVTMVTTH